MICAGNGVGMGPSSGSGITPPYDLSGGPDQVTRSPNTAQNSPPSFLSPTSHPASATATSDCKYRDDEPSCQQVKLEQLNAQHQHHQAQQQQQRYCDPKFDGFDVSASSSHRYGGSNNAGLDSGVHFPMPPSMSGPYLSPNASHGGSAASNGYQYSSMAGLHRQMFNPIAAAVPSEQGWERYT